MVEPSADTRSIVLALLAVNGLQPSEAEIDVMVANYAGARARVDSLYSLPGVRYEEPAITFDPRR